MKESELEERERERKKRGMCSGACEHEQNVALTDTSL